MKNTTNRILLSIFLTSIATICVAEVNNSTNLITQPSQQTAPAVNPINLTTERTNAHSNTNLMSGNTGNNLTTSNSNLNSSNLNASNNLITTPIDQPKPPRDHGFLSTYIPYVGIDFALTNQNYKTGYGKKVFIRYSKEYSGFAGINICNFFGVEIGYVEQPSQIRNPELVAGDSYPGGPYLTTGQFAYLQTSVRITSPYAGIFLQRIVNIQGLGTTRLQAIFAAAAERFKAGEGTLSNQTGKFTIPQYNASYRGFSKTQIVPMLKLAMTVMATDNIGVRVAGTYRGTGHMTINAQENANVQVKMRDTVTIGLGVTYTFGCGVETDVSCQNFDKSA